MRAHPLVGPAAGFLVGVAAGVAGPAFPSALSPALALALSPPLSPAAFAAAGWLAASSVRAKPPAGLPPEPVQIEGRVLSIPSPAGDRVRFLLRRRGGELLEVAAPPADWPLAPGDDVRFPARLRAPPGPANPGGRDIAGRLAASGVALQAVATLAPIRTAPPSPLSTLARARARFAEAANALPPRERGVVRAIGTGDRGALDPATAESFARSGLAHILAVSGLHLVVVAYGLERLLRRILLRIEPLAARFDVRRLSAALVLPATGLYALATGAGVPILRAAVAAGVAFAGVLLDREAGALDTLALAALAIAAGDPGSLLDPSLQLSFAAVAGLALWAGPLRRSLPVPRPRPGTWRARLIEPLLAGACTTIAASVATAPVLAFHFRRLPLLGALANLLGVPIGSALTVVAAISAAVAAFDPGAAAPFLWAARPLASALVALSDAAAAPRWGVVWLGSPGVWGALGASALLVLAGRRRGFARWACATGAAACLAAPPPLRALAARARGGVEVTFLSVGQGDAALLRLPDGAAVLVDGGGATEPGGYDPGARDVLPYLLDIGVRRIAAVFVSHEHADHLNGLPAVAAAIPIDAVYISIDPSDEAARAALARLPPASIAAPGAVWERAGVRIRVVGGPRAGLSPNDASLVLRIEHGETAFLFTGDIESAGEGEALAAGGLAADVVKVPHHGSRGSSTAAFARAVHPRLAVVSAGRGNRFGFPHEEAVARWREVGAEVLRTDEGAVRILSNGRTVRRMNAAAVLDPLAVWREH